MAAPFWRSGWWWVHAALAAILAGLVLCQAGVVFAGSRGPALAAPALVPVDTGKRARLSIEFPVEMVTSDRVGELAAAGTVRLEPEFPVRARWSEPRRLLLEGTEELALATRYVVHVADGLRTVDGRRQGKIAPLPWETARPDLDRTVVLEDAEGRSRLGLFFSQPIDVEALRAALVVREPGGAALAHRVRAAGRDARDGSEFEVEVEHGAALPRAVVMEVAEGLRGRHGPLGTARRITQPIAFVAEARVTGVEAAPGQIEIEFDRSLPLPAADQIVIEPALDFVPRLGARGSALVLTGEFRPGTSYGISLAKGYPGTGRARLAAAQRHNVRVPDLEADLDIAAGGTILSTRARPELRVKGVNVAKLRVQARTIYPNNLVYAFRNGAGHGYSAPEVQEDFATDARPNQHFEQVLDLRRLLGGRTQGLHVISVLAGGQWGFRQHDEVLLQVSDLGITARAAPGAVAVRVRSLATDRPAAGAALRLWTATNQELASGSTDPNGIAVLRFASEGRGRAPYLVEAVHGEERGYVCFDEHRVELAREEAGGPPYVVRGAEAWVWPERGVFRPGETLRAGVLVRDAQGRSPAGLRLKARWSDARGRRRAEQPLRDLGSGLVEIALPTGKEDSTGRWQVEVVDDDGGRRIGHAEVLVEAFVPDRLAARFAAGTLRIGEPGAVALAAEWLEGGACAGLRAQASVSLVPRTPAPEGFESYSFVPGDDAPVPGALAPQEVLLDEAGRATVPVAIGVPEGGWQALEARLHGEVVDPSGRVVRCAATAPVAPRGGLLGVRAAEGAAELVWIGEDGRPAPGEPQVRVQLLQRRWEWQREDRGNGWRWHCTPVGQVVRERTVRLAGGRARVELAPVAASGGSWLVVLAEYEGRRVEAVLGSALRRPDRLRVTAPAAPLAPGAVATAVVEAPFAGTGLCTLEGADLHAAWSLPLRQGRNEVLVHLPAHLVLPNVHLVVTLTAAQAAAGADQPCWIAGSAPLLLAHPQRHAATHVAAPGEVLPETEVRIAIAAAGASRALVALVDEGVLQLTGHADPDPLGFFLARRRLDSSGADSGAELVRSATFDPGTLIGGDGDERAGMAAARLGHGTVETIRTLALSSGVLALGEDGRGEAVFRLPPYEGRLRAMVVVAGPGVVGAASHALVVRAPLGVRLALPRTLAPGDVCETVAVLRNSTGARADVELRLQGEGLEVLEPAALAPLPLDAGEIRSVPVRVRALDRRGVARLVAVASAGTHRRTVAEEATLRPLAVHDVWRAGIAGDGGAEVAVPGAWLADGLRVQVRTSSEPAAQLLPVLLALLEYPHGCLEQTASRGFAVLAARALLPRVASEAAAADTESMARVAVDRILAMQLPSGGLSLWEDGRDEYPFGTLYGLDFLLAAREQGVAVPEPALQALADRALVLLGRSTDVGFRCYAAEVLLRAGRPIGSWLATLAGEAREPEDCARLAIAMARLHDRSGAAEVLERAAAATAPAREHGGMLRSPLRSAALELRARLMATPTAPRVALLVHQIGEAVVRPRHCTTQEQAQALLALAAFHGARGGSRPATRISVLVDGVEHAVAADGSLLLHGRAVRRVGVRGDGMVFATVEVRGERTDPEARGRPGLLARRTVHDPESGAEVREVQRGRRYEVRITGTLPEARANLLVVDHVPSGLEPEPQRFWPTRALGVAGAVLAPDRVEVRDDRVFLFRTAALGAGPFTARYYVRAVFPGTYQPPPCTLEGLYDPDLHAVLLDAQPLGVRR
ncbi:MAG: hypothetical protein IT458_09430 [Planctomycetes bacterium]|nr:hypothetical protein [Planctomycetota bacterium]